MSIAAKPLAPHGVGRRRASLVAELWAARWLLAQWVRRDFIVRYRQSALGLVWSLLQPALLLAVYGVVFVEFLHVRAPRGSYLVFAYCGLAPWTFAANAISSGVGALATTASIIKQVYFPRSVIALAAGGVVVLDLLISVVVLLILQVVTAGTIHVSTVALVPLLGGYLLVVIGVTVFVSVIGAFVRDLRFVVPLVLQMGFIATPIMYPRNLVSGHWAWVLALNPVAQVVTGVRTAVIDGRWPSAGLILGVLGAGVAVLGVSLLYSSSVEDRLPDLL